MTVALAALNPGAQVALAECEQRIERGLRGFVDIGSALAEIRDGRLYKGTHDSFEEYCQERWDIGRDYADRMIAGAQVVLTIVSKGLPAPTKESQARALIAVPEAERAEVWRETVERTNGKPTAAAVAQAAARRSVPTPKAPGPVEADVAPSAVPGATPEPEGPTLPAGSGPDRELVLATLPRSEAEAVGLAKLAEWLGMDREASMTPLRLVLEALEADGAARCTQGPRVKVWWAVGSGSTSPAPESPTDEQPPLPSSEQAEQLRAELLRESERRTAVASIRSVLTYLTSRVLTPERLAEDYLVALDEFSAADLRFAAKTMAALAALKEQ